MKEQEEAERIIEMFKPYANYYVDLNTESGITELEENAKQCAILHVQRVIEELNKLKPKMRYGLETNVLKSELSSKQKVLEIIKNN